MYMDLRVKENKEMCTCKQLGAIRVYTLWFKLSCKQMCTLYDEILNIHKLSTEKQIIHMYHTRVLTDSHVRLLKKVNNKYMHMKSIHICAVYVHLYAYVSYI